MATFLRVLLSVLMAGVLTPTSGSTRPKYWVVRLKDNGAIFSVSPGGFHVPRLNDKLEVIMSAYQTVPRAGIWSNGALQRPPLPAGLDDLIPLDINNSTDICGYTTNGVHKHGFYSDLTATSELSVFDSTHYLSNNVLLCMYGEAHGINDAGAISGWLGRKLDNQDKFETRPVIWREKGGIPEAQGTLSGYPLDSVDYDRPVYINASGQIAGTAVLKTAGQLGQHRAYFGNLGYLVELSQLPGGKYSFVNDISDAGHVVGYAYDSVASGQHVHAFLYHGGSTIDIHGTTYGPTFKSVAWSVNASGHAVGAFQGATGANINALYYDGDSTYRLGSLIVNPPGSAGGPPFQNFLVATDINNAGAIVGLYTSSFIDYPCLLWPYFDGVVVNSEGDLPDMDQNDGRCWTGGYNVLGQEECTMRAAIRHTNLTAAKDTIKFNIPGNWIPSITTITALPVVSQPVVIDATTQPGSGRVRLNGAGLTAPGIDITAGKSTVQGLIIRGFDAPAISLTNGDSNLIIQNVIGPDSTGADGIGNQTGIIVSNSSHNVIGDPDKTKENIIAYNRYAGVRILSGAGNTIRRNSIFSNGELGIDIDILGPNANDTLDIDGGANTIVNHPYIDSVVHKLGQTYLYGHLMGERNMGYVMEYFLSDSIDPSGYGEGKTSMWTHQVNANADGVAHFVEAISLVNDSGKFWSATATDYHDNTSEFSPCWPQKRLTIVDFTAVPIPNTWFGISKVQHDRPTFTETFLDSVQTDGNGAVDIARLMTNFPLRVGDSIKVSRLLKSLPKVRNTYGLLSTALSIHLDNAVFDDVTYKMSFDSLTANISQVIKVAHTTLAVNLVASIEWEADVSYLESMGRGIRYMSNYLYDVTDGQMRIDTVWILNNHASWNIADVRVWATNAMVPESEANGFFAAGSKDHMNMTRQWFGSEELSMDSTVIVWPMRPDAETNYRTLAHEIGHYVMDFFDEYEVIGRSRCYQLGYYGFMDMQYSKFEPTASEMSGAKQYENEVCRKTEHYVKRNMSCWDYFEGQWERMQNGIVSPIMKPNERQHIGNSHFYYGPNDNGADLDYDVGRLVVLNIPKTPRVGHDTLVTVRDLRTGLPIRRAGTTHTQSSSGRLIQEGGTSVDGKIYFLGVREGDVLHLTSKQNVTVANKSILASGGAGTEWLSGTKVLTGTPAGDLAVDLAPVAGEFPMLSAIRFSGATTNLQLDYTSPLPGTPSYLFAADSGVSISGTMTSLASHYETLLPVDSIERGNILITALDDSSHTFFFIIEFSKLNQGAGEVSRQMFSNDLKASLLLDSTSADRSVIITSSDYLIPLNGLNPGSAQLGKTVAIFHSNGPSLAQPAALSLSYNSEELASSPPPMNEEVRLHVHKWNGSVWEALGSWNDTAANIVSAPITSDGFYALFTTDISTATDESGDLGLPGKFEVSQNYPNPFNPTTTISFSVPSRTAITLEIFNVLGQKVRSLVDDIKAAGTYSIEWDGRNDIDQLVSTGVYLYRFRAGEVVQTRKMLLIK